MAYGAQPSYYSSSPYHLAAYTNNIQQPIPYGPAIAIPYTTNAGHTTQQQLNGHYQPSHIIPVAAHGNYHHGGVGVAAAHVQQIPVAHSANAFTSYRSNDIVPTTATGKVYIYKIFYSFRKICIAI